MKVTRSGDNRDSGEVTVLPHTHMFYFADDEGKVPVIRFFKSDVAIRNLNGKYIVRADLDLSDLGLILDKVLQKARSEPAFREAVCNSLRKHDATMFRLAVLLANSNTESNDKA